MNITKRTKLRLLREAKAHAVELGQKISTHEAACMVGNVIKNPIMADGLIKLLMAFGFLDHIASKREGLVPPFDRDEYIEAAIAVSYQSFISQYIIKKEKKSRDPKP
jgi:hypothetical protein